MRRVVPFVLLAAAAFSAGCGSGGGRGSNPRPAPAGGYRVQASQRAIPFANGLAAGSYSLLDHKVDTFRDHIYAKPTASTVAVDFCYDLYFGWRRNGASAWLPSTLE